MISNSIHLDNVTHMLKKLEKRGFYLDQNGLHHHSTPEYRMRVRNQTFFSIQRINRARAIIFTHYVKDLTAHLSSYQLQHFISREMNVSRLPHGEVILAFLLEGYPFELIESGQPNVTIPTRRSLPEIDT